MSSSTELSSSCTQHAQCRFGARCLEARCTCLNTCSDNSNSYASSSDNDFICGSDGRDYSSECELRSEECRTQTSILIKYSTKCDPCAGHACPPLSTCQLDETRRAICTCDEEPCREELLRRQELDNLDKNGLSGLNGAAREPVEVCASDGTTYASECFLEVAACRTRNRLRIVSKGKCVQGMS